MNLLEWIERLGGWAVVLIIVRWMMRNSDEERAKSDEDRRLFKEAVEEFRGHRRESDKAHELIVENQRVIVTKLESIMNK